MSIIYIRMTPSLSLSLSLSVSLSLSSLSEAFDVVRSLFSEQWFKNGMISSYLGSWRS